MSSCIINFIKARVHVIDLFPFPPAGFLAPPPRVPADAAGMLKTWPWTRPAYIRQEV
jgi:hypothetical protein